MKILQYGAVSGFLERVPNSSRPLIMTLSSCVECVLLLNTECGKKLHSTDIPALGSPPLLLTHEHLREVRFRIAFVTL